MIEDLVAIHQEVMATTPTDFVRYLYPHINWKAPALCILGDRGVGKTTMICQDLKLRYGTPDRALYLSADHISVASFGLFAIAKEFFSLGGEALYIDEVHKFPNWSIEIKSILDTYKERQVVFSASSSLDLTKSKADLSRRVVYHKLAGLSFREYLHLNSSIELPALSLEEILEGHVSICDGLKGIHILKLFREYLQHGYYPFFLEGVQDYLLKVSNVIEKVLFEDIAVVYNLKQTTLPTLRKLIWLVATSKGLVPNIDRISKELEVSRDVVYNCLEYLSNSGLLHNLYPMEKGLKLVRKPGKIFLDNTNLLHAVHGTLQFDTDIGAIRETFFSNQIAASGLAISLHKRADFIIDSTHVIEVGGPSKGRKQIQGLESAYLAVDGTEIGFGKKIPLYLFGFLY